MILDIKSDEIRIDMDRPADLVALAVKKNAIRCRVLNTGQPITLRKNSYKEVEGEILTVMPSKIWRHNRTYYMAGEIESTRMDIPALKLDPLPLKNLGTWNPKEEYWGEPDEEICPYFKPIIEFGPRQEFEMGHFIPEDLIKDDPDSDLIYDAADCYEQNDYEGAYKILEKLLVRDLRCLDAHAHLGNWEFNSTDEHREWVIDKARRHYEVGVRIGELSLRNDFNGVLSWGFLENRPFLRCLHGYGLSLWRLEKAKEARSVFEKMLWLNPSDNQGVRFLLADIDEGKSWAEAK